MSNSQDASTSTEEMAANNVAATTNTAANDIAADQSTGDLQLPVIEVATQAGACYGVQRALDMVEQAASGEGGDVHTLGPLIHNPRVVDDLRRRGVGQVDQNGLPTLQRGSRLVVRTHGVVPQLIDEAHSFGLDVIDATCPHVKKVHKSVALLRAEGYQVLIVGESGHPEVEAILGHAGPGALVIQSAEEIDALPLKSRVGVVVQTTQTAELLRACVERLVTRVSELRVFNTICQATRLRQQAAAELANRADVMIVVGGRNSGNTTRLAQICRQVCPSTYHIESEQELKAQWFAGARFIGVTAGASTPESQISAVVQRIRELTQ